MKGNSKKEEILTRREFFKKTSRAVLPIIGMAVLGPTVLISCDKIEDFVESGCTDCSSGCEGSCKDSCSSGCKGSCSSSCYSTCSGTCSSTCKSTCKGSCSNTCSTTCKGSCGTSCKKLKMSR